MNSLVDLLAPRETPQRKARLAGRILALFGDDRSVGNMRITPEALMELISRHAQCVHDQTGKCPLILFCRPMAWELNEFFGVGNQEDKGFRRYSDMAAARPLRDHSAEELE